MRTVYWAGVIVIAALVSLFAASNREIVSLGLWPFPFVAAAPLYLVVVVALLFGFAAGAVGTWIRGHRRRREWRECRRQNAALSRELAATQSQLAPPSQTMRNAPPPAR